MFSATKQALKNISQILHDAGWDKEEPAPETPLNLEDMKDFRVEVHMADPPQVEVFGSGKVLTNNLETTRAILKWLQRKIETPSGSL